jgi:Sulfotransferase family
MLGQHPQAVGLPEVNLFMTETLDELCQKAVGQRRFLIHGLLRTVAHLYAGEQTVESIAMAWRWINRRRAMRTGEVYRELCQKVAPRRLVDKSPAYSQQAEILERLEREFPDVQYLFLIRNPIDQGNSMIRAPEGLMELLVRRSVDFNENPPRIEPQFQWFKTQTSILNFLDQLPEERRFILRGETLLQEPEKKLCEICQRLGLEWSESACARMLRPEDSPFACMGPQGAPWGNNPGFQRSPQFRRLTRAPGSLERPLPWREGEHHLFPEVVQLAQSLGYS